MTETISSRLSATPRRQHLTLVMAHRTLFVVYTKTKCVACKWFYGTYLWSLIDNFFLTPVKLIIIISIYLVTIKNFYNLIANFQSENQNNFKVHLARYSYIIWFKNLPHYSLNLFISSISKKAELYGKCWDKILKTHNFVLLL